MPESTKKPFTKGDIIKLLVLAVLFIAASVAILEIQFFPGVISQLKVNDVAPDNIVAPASISYESEIATVAERDRAESRVTAIYSLPDPEVARTQLAVADSVLAFLDAVRADTDPNLSAAEKLDWVMQLQPVSLSKEEAADILNLSESLWQDAKQEVRFVLDEAMRTEIRESQLIGVRRRLDLLVSADVPDAEAAVIGSIVEDLVQPNTFVDEERTFQARQDARNAVQPVYRTLEQNEVIVRDGERITAEQIEALQALGLQQPGTRWRKAVSTTIWVTILIMLLGYYMVRYHANILKDNQKLAVLGIFLLMYVAGIRIVLPNSTPSIEVYTLPVVALTITLAALLNSRLALMVTLIVALLEGYVAGGSLEVLAYVLLSGFIIGLAIDSRVQLNTLLWAGLFTILSNSAVIIIFRFFENDADLVNLLARLGAGVLNGVLSAGLPLLAFFVVGNLTDIVTYFQLLDLARPTQPLLTELLRRAPGTYHHSLLVSNLAEQAAERIEADAFLCRVGAYYHDVGKIMRPYFFTENSPPGGSSLHTPLDPKTSAEIIIDHVTDGLKLAKKHRLPSVIQAFISEHHGTEVVGYFYHKAVQAAGGDETRVDRTKFTYPGPKPQTKETAILMLADASEATVRSAQPQSPEEIDNIVKRTISNRMKSGQFDECGLTMRDLEQIRLAFIDVLQGVSHPRIKYPGQDETKKEETGPLPPLPLGVQRADVSAETQTQSTPVSGGEKA